MTNSTSRKPIGRAIRSRWRGLGHRGRIGAILIAVAVIGAGGGFAYRWWSAWPPRLILVGSGPMFPLAFSPDGKTLATGGEMGLAFWDVATGLRLNAREVPADRKFSQGAFTPDGRTFVGFTYEPTPTPRSRAPVPEDVIRIDVATGRVLGSVTLGYCFWLGHTFSNDGRTMRVVTLAMDPPQDTQVVTVDLEHDRVIGTTTLTVPPAGFALEVSGDGKFLASVEDDPMPGGERDAALVWDIDADRAWLRLPGSSRVTSMACGPGGSTVAVGRAGGEVEVWDGASRSVLATFTPHARDYVSHGLTLSPDGSTLLSFGEMWYTSLSLNTVRRYVALRYSKMDWYPPSELVAIDRTSGRILGRLPSEDRPVFSPDGRTLATRHDDGSVRLRDVPSP